MRFNSSQFNEAQFNDPEIIYYDPYPPTTSNAWTKESLTMDESWTKEAQPSTP